MQNKKQKIQKLKKRLAELYKVYGDDVKVSHHESGQTLEIISLIEKQISELKTPGRPLKENIRLLIIMIKLNYFW